MTPAPSSTALRQTTVKWMSHTGCNSPASPATCCGSPRYCSTPPPYTSRCSTPPPPREVAAIKECAYCSGSGEVRYDTTCDVCDGKRKYGCDRCNQFGMITLRRPCGTCGGKGWNKIV